MKKDRVVKAGGSYQKMDEDLDQLIEENFNLQEEERKIMQQVKKLQKKKQESIMQASGAMAVGAKKELYNTMQEFSANKVSPQKAKPPTYGMS